MNLKANVPGTNSNMVGVSNSEINMSDIRAIRSENAEVIHRNKIACRVTGNDSDKTQMHLSERQSLWRPMNQLDWR